MKLLIKAVATIVAAVYNNNAGSRVTLVKV